MVEREMGGSPSDEQQRDQPGTEICIPQRRKMVQKRVVTVEVEGRTEKLQKVDGPRPPDDLWSWRKYGQKPIKGSPFPRGYYKCSTAKGCTAKKQVERCRTDATLLIITYTSTHNHSAPKLPLHGNSDAEGAQTHVGPNSTTVKSDLEARDSAEEEHAMTSSTKSTQEPSSEENDFFDELEELPIFSSTTLQRNSFFDDGILLHS